MQIHSTYSIKIKSFGHIFKETVSKYRDAVDFFIGVMLQEKEAFADVGTSKDAVAVAEVLSNPTKYRPNVRYDFSKDFYKFPSYLRRAAIAEAFGKVTSYWSNLTNWQKADAQTRGRKPSYPVAGYVYPCMYRDNMYKTKDTYTAQVKSKSNKKLNAFMKTERFL